MPRVFLSLPFKAAMKSSSLKDFIPRRRDLAFIKCSTLATNWTISRFDRRELRRSVFVLAQRQGFVTASARLSMSYFVNDVGSGYDWY